MQIISILGAIQGLFFSILLISKKGRKISDIYLSLFLLGSALYMTFFYLISLNAAYEYPVINFIFSGIPLLLGPFLYFYVDAILSGTNKFFKWHILHFIPFVVIYYLKIDFLSLAYNKQHILLNTPFKFLPERFQTAEVLWIISSITYSVWIILLLFEHKKNLQEKFSSFEKVNLKWLLTLSFSFASIVLLYSIGQFIENHDIYAFSPKIEFYLVLFFTSFIFIIGFYGLKQEDVFLSHSTIETSNKKQKKKLTSPVLMGRKDNQPVFRLLEFMEKEKPFLEPDLTVYALASKMEMTSAELSVLLNERLNKHFFEFINQYRVEEVKKRLNEPENKAFTLLSIAFECGFNSKASFNRVFKNITGETPSQYLKNIS